MERVKKKTIQSILFTGGGTLGHIFPMIPVVTMLKKENPGIRIYFIGTKSGLEKEFVEKTGLFEKTFYLDAQGFVRKLSLSNLITIWKYIKTYRQSRKLLKELKPDIVVGMGGYISGSVLKAAIRGKKKTVIHEQNSVYGLANRILKNKVDLVLLSYPIEEGKNIKVVGNPRISEIYERYKDKIQPVNERSILVVGGSRGAKAINDLVLSLKDEFSKHHIKVTLITGNTYYQENKAKIEAAESERFMVKSLVRDLSQYLIDARVVVTRCGATTLAEVMALRKVCLLIPSPNVTNNHQEKNAAEIVGKEGALMIRESELNANNFMEAILLLLDNKELRNRIINTLILISDVHACRKFVEQLDELMEQ